MLILCGNAKNTRSPQGSQAQCEDATAEEPRTRRSSKREIQGVDGIAMKCWPKREPQIAAECILKRQNERGGCNLKWLSPRPSGPVGHGDQSQHQSSRRQSVESKCLMSEAVGERSLLERSKGSRLLQARAQAN